MQSVPGRMMPVIVSVTSEKLIGMDKFICSIMDRK